MKSLALNLLKTLLLLIFGVVLAAATNSSRSSSSAAATATATSSAKTLINLANRRALPTTTAIPPSLQAPPHLQLRRHTLPATAATTTTTTAKTTIQMASASGSSSRQRLPLARHAAKQITTTTTATTKPTTSIMTNSRRKPIISETSTLDSTRQVRHIDATTASTASTPVSVRNGGAGVRQQRSFHSNGAQPYEDTETKRKYKTVERRQYTRSYNSPSTTTTTTRKPQQHLSALRQRTATLYDGSNTSRQSKLSSLPLHDDDLKTTKTTTTTAASTSSTSDATASNHGNAKLTTLHNQQTPKTPRMIQRLVAGHIQNAEGRSTYQVSAVTSNSTITNSTTATKISSTNSTPARHALMSSSYRSSQLNANIRVASTTASTTTTTSTSKSGETLIDSNHDVDYHDDDEALLDDPGDFDNWDNGILRLSAGSGKENNLKPKKVKEEAKKTLSDQVRDGKYGLIEKELFRRTPKRPGVLSYLPNKEVPEDNERNFGGLNEEDIWLAEDHLLVIKGGSLNEDNPEEPWPAIDDYNAAGRQIKIPSNPKVPPPFPVQLEENGPVQLIGNNKLTIVYPLSNESLPVYTIGTQTHNTPSTDASDDEKNLITRPGKAKNAQENEPGYNYPSPALPWLYNNQTLANPSVSEGDKPVNFPVLGPFLYGRNGSLDNINGTEDFDEDDPSLYYPPAYSFVYKSNYSNRVPPGPLVPGIVVPPPPEQFSKLEKSHKEKRPQSPAIRYRISSTTSPTPTTTTISTTTTTTTELPYRQVFTKISEYTPKIINIANPSPRPVYTPTQSTRFSISPSPTPPPRNIEPVPVPVAVPIPIYSINSSPNVRPNIISFVPTTPEPNVETLSKANPIYYEYFEAKRQQGSANVVDDYAPTTSKPITVSKPIKLYATSKRPFKAQGHRNYLQPVPPNHRYVDDGGVVITPKPEIRYKSRPIFKQRPLQNFEQEVNAIRETLRYYQNQELRDNNIPRTPKAKPVFDYNYEGSKTETEGDVRNQFQPPVEYDGEPFKPMVTYSPAVNDENAFRALGVDKIGSDEDQPQGREDFAEAPKYPTTTLLPVQPQGRPKKLRIGAKYLQQPPQQQSYVNAPQRQPSWLAVNKQEFNEYVQAESPPQRERYQDPVPQAVPVIATRNREYPGYYYSPGRQNNRFYEEPFQNIPSRKIINYRPQQQTQQQQPQPLPPQQQQPIWSLENDTLVNELPNRPPINPDAEFIDPYLVGHHSINNNYPYQQQQQQQQPPPQQQRLVYQQQPLQRPPPPISHQSQYYARPQRIPGRQYQQQLQQQQQQLPLPPSPPFSLQNDELVNYRQPLPPINPDSEWITHPNVIRNQQPQQFFRSNNYRLPPPPQPAALPNVGGEADVYYLSPKYRRANNLNNNSNNRYQQQQQQQQHNNGNVSNNGK